MMRFAAYMWVLMDQAPAGPPATRESKTQATPSNCLIVGLPQTLTGIVHCSL